MTTVVGFFLSITHLRIVNCKHRKYLVACGKSKGERHNMGAFNRMATADGRVLSSAKKSEPPCLATRKRMHLDSFRLNGHVLAFRVLA